MIIQVALNMVAFFVLIFSVWTATILIRLLIAYLLGH